jgi:hypothetical protein
MKRVIKVLVVTTLLAVILATNISPALARPAHFGNGLKTDRPCDVHAGMAHAQHGGGAQLVDDPDPPERTGCWVVLPGQG